MANRHEIQKKAKGGGVKPKHDPNKEEYNGKGSRVMKEAKEEKRGGAVKKATGGAVEHKAAGGAAKPRLDKRARGGATGKDMKSSPWSAAHVSTNGDAGK